MKIIIEHRKDWVLQVRAARTAIEDGLKVGDYGGSIFEDGRAYGVKRNKDSVRVYPNCEDR